MRQRKTGIIKYGLQTGGADSFPFLYVKRLKFVRVDDCIGHNANCMQSYTN